MTTHEEFITMVLAMREAQRELEERPNETTRREVVKLSTRVDTWLQKYVTEKVQLDFWIRSAKGSEEPGVYDVGHGDEKEQAFEE